LVDGQISSDTAVGTFMASMNLHEVFFGHIDSHSMQ
jgi:hypothetical protein